VYSEKSAHYWTPVQGPARVSRMNSTTRPSAHELTVLRALLRLARRRAPADLEQLLVRVGGQPSELRTAVRSLERAGYVERRSPGSGAVARLTMSGFAVAVAAVATRRDARVRAAKTIKKGRARRRAA